MLHRVVVYLYNNVSSYTIEAKNQRERIDKILDKGKKLSAHVA